MLFNSWQFIIFFTFVTAIYFLFSQKHRPLILLLASCVFYMAFIPAYIVILFITITIDYFAGIWIENSEGLRRKIWLIISIVSTCAVLFIFKYFNFFSINLNYLANAFHLDYQIRVITVILPIGLSFHTFQSLSYVIEVYKRKQKTERNFLIYALYVMFYPQLVAGPIERPQNLLHQFYEEHLFDFARVASGVRLMLWGLFKKIVVADRLAILVNGIYSNPKQYEGPVLGLATFFFAFQIYYDFSAYSEIAIGAARVMGFRLMENFKMPYLSKSISEFWQRWHISLSTWFRDYIYVPLGGNRVSSIRWCVNILATFLISGLWHGANWTFLVWGGLNGLYLVFSIWTQKIRSKVILLLNLHKFERVLSLLRIVYVFFLISFSWIFFRALNLNDAFYICKQLFKHDGYSSINHIVQSIKNGFPGGDFICAVSFLLLLGIGHVIGKNIYFKKLFRERMVMRWVVYYVLLLSITFFGGIQSSKFIYFQF